MIVADTNTIFYLIVRGERSPEADRVFEKDSEWAAPLLWRSEFRNALTLYLRRGILSLDEALQYMGDAEVLLGAREHRMASERVLKLAADSGCSAYDCEFVALAQDLGVPLVTADSELLEKFRPRAISMRAFCK